MRRLLPLLIALMPLTAAAQVLGTADTYQPLLAPPAGPLGPASPATAVPLWRGANGQLLVLEADGSASLEPGSTPLSFRAVDAASAVSAGLQYGLDPHLQLHAGVSERSWANHRTPRVVGSELGATYNSGRYSIDLSVGANSTANPSLPRVLPGAAPGVNGLADFDSSAQLNARGRVALDGKSGVDVGASVGRIRLLPGNLLGVNTLDQKALSFGVDHGPLSGAIVGRTMQPSIPGNLSADRRWNSIDLGVTWRLPWQGELSIGAQNVWSSGTPVNTPVGPEPDQSRTPYVQYHQDL